MPTQRTSKKFLAGFLLYIGIGVYYSWHGLVFFGQKKYPAGITPGRV